MKTFLSLGVGLQSTALYYMSALGQLPRFDAAIFADTGAEKSATIDYLQSVLLPWAALHNAPPIVIMNDRSLLTDILSRGSTPRFASIPAFTAGADGRVGMLRRQCTMEYKIRPVNQALRALQGIAPRKHTPPTRLALGITLDEITRVTNPEEGWKHHWYPFIGYTVNRGIVVHGPGLRMSRQDVSAWFTRHGIEAPPKSGCLMCPFQTDHAWRSLKASSKPDWLKAIQIDESIRNATKQGVHQPVFLHKSLQPLASVSFSQTDMFEECTGYCHT